MFSMIKRFDFDLRKSIGDLYMTEPSGKSILKLAPMVSSNKKTSDENSGCARFKDKFPAIVPVCKCEQRTLGKK